MKKITLITLVSMLALFGCDSDDAKDAAQGNTKVVALDGINVKGFPLVDDGYYNEEKFNSNGTLNTTLTFKNKNDLENLGVSVKGESCALLTKKAGESEACFDIEDGQNICMPKEFESFGYRVFTIDLKNLALAEKNDFQRIDSLKLFKRLDFNQVDCNSLK